MALTLAQGVALVADTDFQNRVAMGFYFVAKDVITEDPDTPGHENRLRFAWSVVLQSYDTFATYTAMVVADSAIADGSATPESPPSDSEITTAIEGMWNLLSNVQLLPEQVTDLAGTPNAAEGTVSLDWSDIPTAINYLVYRDDTLVGTPNVSEFVDEPAPGTYNYTVGASNGAGLGPWSNIATVLLDSP